MTAFSTDDTERFVAILKWLNSLKPFMPQNTKIIQICHPAKRSYVQQFISGFVRPARSTVLRIFGLHCIKKKPQYKRKLFLRLSGMLHRTIWYRCILRRLAVTLAVVSWGQGWGGSPTVTCLLQVTGVGATNKCYFGLMKHLSSKLSSHKAKSIIFRNIN